MVTATRPVRVRGQTARSHVTHVQAPCRRGSQPSGATSSCRGASSSLPAGRACFTVYEATCGDGGAHRASNLDAPRLPKRSPSCRHSFRCIAQGRASGVRPAAQPALAGAPLRERQDPDRDWANKASEPSSGPLYVCSVISKDLHASVAAAADQLTPWFSGWASSCSLPALLSRMAE